MTAVQYPSSQSVISGNIVTTAGPNLGTGYDVMGRPSTLTDLATNSAIISAATYGAANQLLTLSGQITETRSYNSLMQLTQLVSSNTSGGSINISYAYSSTQNNGKITSKPTISAASR